MENFKDRFNYILLKHLPITENDITTKAKLKEDLGADSLDMVELIMEFEKEFSIRLPDDAIDHAHTVGSIEDLIKHSIAITKQIN